jgi:creatinine amidohydrolase
VESNNLFPVMENMTVKMVADYLKKKQSIIIPIGVIEQHGYHLPLKTDALIATHLGRRAGAKTGILVGPTIHQSFSGGGLTGTINISPAVMSLVISDTLISLVAQGFKNFYLFLCHGGSENARALEDAVKMLLRNNPAFEKAMIALIPVWKTSSKGMGWSKAIAEHDWHAGWLETSLVMALEPELVRMEELALDAEPYLSQQIEHPDRYQHAQKIVDDPLVIPKMTQRPEIKVGVMGFPKRASVEIGKQMAEDMVNNLTNIIVELETRADGVYKEVAFTLEPIILNPDE